MTREKSQSAKLHVIGLGASEKPLLSDAAKSALTRAHLIIGSSRQLEIIKGFLNDTLDETSDLIENTEYKVLPKLGELKAVIQKFDNENTAINENTVINKKTVILASGDPLYYGIGRWCLSHFKREEIRFYPAISSIQFACSVLGFALQDVNVLSLHGRPLEKIRRSLKSNQTLMILTDKNSTPQILAKECLAANFQQSIIWVCENLGFEKQRVRHFSVLELIDMTYLTFDPLHVTVIQTRGDGGVMPEFPGIPDASFSTGAKPGQGMITKREVRLVIASLLQPSNDDVIWDVGAGCGGVAVELSFWNECVAVYAIEHNAERLQNLRINRKKFGVMTNLNVIQGRAPDACNDLPLPNKIFIGGSDGEMPIILNQFWQRLPENGLLVASAVTEKTKMQLATFAESLSDDQVESVELAVNKGLMTQGKLSYQSKLPVTLFRFKK
ncbi:MAG: precorrin-6y C5,15-methyltransferase (decarboxylating) subunit CbiE [Pseudomonadales bacterium]|nr:precorrin-6y C5,15-methyltransferase (decarboxylating) subunit CbiE [Pseudomonadales bacterium]